MSKKTSDNKKINKLGPPRVVVAMSGGVDSSVAAYLLKKEGYDVVGIFLKFWSAPSSICSTKKSNLCCDMKALNQARQLAGQLDIPFFVIDVSSQFKKSIVDYFISEYAKGRTPNPCVKCNRFIKFGVLWEKAKALGADYLATGHYVRQGRKKTKNKKQKTKKPDCHSSFGFCRSKDEKKDQTYFLSSIDPDVLPHLLFPIGDMKKEEVRKIAKKANIKVHGKKDSVGICFIPDGDTEMFLKHFTKKLAKPGDIVDKYGNKLGRHGGLLGYTLGEKIGDDEVAGRYQKIANIKCQISNKIQNPNDKNFEIGNLKFNYDIPRMYVVGIDIKKNRLIAGENEDCFAREMGVSDWNLIDCDRDIKPSKMYDLLVQIRGGHKPEKARVKDIIYKKSAKKPIDKIIFEFQKPVRAITPGQTAAVYDLSGALIGGGTIVSP